MDSEERGGQSAEPSTNSVRIQFLQIHRNQARLPVVTVQHLWPEVDVRQNLQYGPAEKDEPADVIDVVLRFSLTRAVLINAPAEGGIISLVVLRLLNEIDDNLRVRQSAAAQPAGHLLVPDRNRERDGRVLDRQSR
jgi:hypothetical protein